MFLMSRVIVPGSTYWNLGFGMNPGEVAKDEDGNMLIPAGVLGQNIFGLYQA